jgi:hypothetical protein
MVMILSLKTRTAALTLTPQLHALQELTSRLADTKITTATDRGPRL